MGKTIAQTLIEEGKEKGIQQGLQEGLQKGLQRGLQKGLLQGMRQLLLETLEMKFEAIPKELIKIINSIKNTETLRILHHHAMKCNTIDDFRENMRTIIKK
jgi:flagellar biosynthesis/type III secretory pathway protein FliH